MGEMDTRNNNDWNAKNKGEKENGNRIKSSKKSIYNNKLLYKWGKEVDNPIIQQ